MIDIANMTPKPVMIMQSVLNSMVKKENPTRYEASEISTAVLDGVDCMVLCHETSDGDRPADCVWQLSKLLSEAEKTIHYKNTFQYFLENTPTPTTTEESVAASAV